MTLHRLTSERFRESADEALADAELQANLARLRGNFLARRARARDSLPEFDELVDEAVGIKNHVLEHLDNLSRRLRGGRRGLGGHSPLGT